MKKKEKTIDQPRKTGIELIGDVPWGTHFCQFYRTKEDLIEILVPYFKAGLENNEFCMWITSEPLNVEDAKRALQKKVKSFDEYINKGQIEILDYSRWYTKSGRFNADKVLEDWAKKEKQAVQKGYDGLRLTGNTFWLEQKGWRDFTAYEAAVNSVIGKHRMLAVCTYCLDKCGPAEIVDVVGNHQFALVKRKTGWSYIESFNRRRTEQELRRSEARYRAVVEDQTELICRWLPGEILTFVNDAYCRYFGKKREDLLGQSFMHLVSEQDRQRLTEHFAALNRHNPAAIYEHRVIAKNGQVHWLQWTNRAIFDEHGCIVEFQSVGRDITDHRRAELEILKLNEELELRVAQRTASLTKTHKQLLEEIEERKCLQREILNISERQKRQIGQELHDSIGQQFVGIALMTKVLEQKLAAKLPDEAASAAEIARLVNQAMERAKNLAKGLHPVDLNEGGLTCALQELATTTERMFDVSCILKCERVVPIDNTTMAVHLYRIAQEAITNAIKHGEAKNVEIVLASDRHKSVLTIKSDGLDFPETVPKSMGMGLKIMGYRAEMLDGSFNISKGDQGGTVVTCVFSNKNISDNAERNYGWEKTAG